MLKSLDRKLAAIHADPHGARQFIIADAKDADMAFGLRGPGQLYDQQGHPTRFRTLAEYREQMRGIVKQGLVDILLMSNSTSEQLTLKEKLFESYLPLTNLPVAEANPLADEQREFLAAIRGERRVRVSGYEGRNALDVAEHILTSIAGHRWDGSTQGSSGPRFASSGVLKGPHWHKAAVRRKAG